MGLFDEIMNIPPQVGSLADLVSAGSRGTWNERLARWESPASDSEEAIIERAARMVRTAIAGNAWLTEQGVTVHAQGSYHNNTNVRQESDMDLRVVHPDKHVKYDPNVNDSAAYDRVHYVYTGRTPIETFERMRRELVTCLSSAFGGVGNLDLTGNKAIQVNAVPGSRAKADVVPAMVFDYVVWNAQTGKFDTHEGTYIRGKNGSQTFNFPDQHSANGVAKRARTGHQFKKVVRIFKNLRDQMKSEGIAAANVPSFLIECLVYAVEDQYFTHEDDDRYSRTLRVAERMKTLAHLAVWPSYASEISERKLLIHADQAWTLQQVKDFTVAATNRLRGA